MEGRKLIAVLHSDQDDIVLEPISVEPIPEDKFNLRYSFYVPKGLDKTHWYQRSVIMDENGLILNTQPMNHHQGPDDQLTITYDWPNQGYVKNWMKG